MKFSAKSEYAIRAVLDIAIRSAEGPVQVKEIAGRQFIPERFLEQVLSGLKRAGLVKSLRGAQGGYLLGRSADQMTLADLIQAVEGPITLMECTSEEVSSRCRQSTSCVVKDVWSDVQSALVDALNSVTVEDMCRRRKEKEKYVPMYDI
jgi:Rrf2 family protein